MRVEVICVEYYSRPDVTVKQSDGKKFRSYLSQGYYVAYRKEDGFCLLRKKTQIRVTIRWEQGTEKFEKVINLQKTLNSFYGKLPSWRLVELFRTDLAKDVVAVEMDSNGYYTIVKK